MLKEFRENSVGLLTLVAVALAIYGLVKLSTPASAAPFGSYVTPQSCCANDDQKPHLLIGTYYSVKHHLTAKLLLNNKGPQPLAASPTLYSMSGER